QDLTGVRADLTALGKALGGGIVPVSAVVGRGDVLDVLTPGTHGSTFGGNPLACAVGLAVVDLLRPGTLQARARELGRVLRDRTDAMVADGLLARARTVGLWAGLDVESSLGLTGRQTCELLADAGVLAKDTHGRTIRLAPPLIIDEDDLDLAMTRLHEVLLSARGRAWPAAASPVPGDVGGAESLVGRAGRHHHDRAHGVMQHSLTRGAEEQAGETATAAGADDHELDGGGELRHEGGRVAVERVLTDRDLAIAHRGLDGHTQPFAHVRQDVLAVDRGRQPRHGAGA